MPVPVESVTLDASTELKKTESAEVKLEVVKVAPTIKEIEADEPLLQENPHRFVLFPIKYHEVGSLRLSSSTN